MSVLIKQFKFPKCCYSCPISDYSDELYCNLVDSVVTEFVTRRHPDCPLVDVPTPHGDLIDRQKLLEDNKHLEYPIDGKYRKDRAWATGFNNGASHCNSHAVYAKTVIEAESEVEDE